MKSEPRGIAMTRRRELWIRVGGRISEDTAVALGAEPKRSDGVHELVFDYIDQAHLTGVLIRLSDLHISYDHVEIRDAEPRHGVNQGEEQEERRDRK